MDTPPLNRIVVCGFIGWFGFIRMGRFGTAIFIFIGITKCDLEVTLCFIFVCADVFVE